jgi:hypothetical protein
MVLAPLEPWVAEGGTATICMAQGASLDHGAPVSRPGLMFEKSSHRPTRYR